MHECFYIQCVELLQESRVRFSLYLVVPRSTWSGRGGGRGYSLYTLRVFHFSSRVSARSVGLALRGRREGAVNRRGQSAAAQLSIRVTNDIMVHAMTEKIDRYCRYIGTDPPTWTALRWCDTIDRCAGEFLGAGTKSRTLTTLLVAQPAHPFPHRCRAGIPRQSRRHSGFAIVRMQ